MQKALTSACAILVLLVGTSFGSITADLTATDFGFWILGATAPTNGKPIAVASGAADEDYVQMGLSSPFYWETADGFDDEGSVEFWIYDSAVSLLDGASAISGNGPYWGLRSTDLGQVMVIGVFRRTYIAGDQGYSPWSSVNPFSPAWFRDGLRASHSLAFSAGWYKWSVAATFDDATFTIFNVNAWACDGTVCRQTPASIMDVTETFDAAYADQLYASVFGFGFSGLAFEGDAAGGLENFHLQIIGGTSVFSEVGAALAIAPTATSSWGAIKQLY